MINHKENILSIYKNAKRKIYKEEYSKIITEMESVAKEGFPCCLIDIKSVVFVNIYKKIIELGFEISYQEENEEENITTVFIYWDRETEVENSNFIHELIHGTF